MKTRLATLIVLAFTAIVPSHAQDLNHYKKIVKELSSSTYQGRGYARDGVVKACDFIEDEFRKAGVSAVALQPFRLDVNTFPNAMKMSVDGHKLEAGTEFVMREYSPGVHGTFNLYYVDTTNYDSGKMFSDLAKAENKNAFVVCDFKFTYKHKEDFARLQKRDRCQNAGVIFVWDSPLKFYKAYGEKVVDKPVVWVSKDFPKDAKQVKFNVDNVFLEKYKTNNVIAKINGKRHDKCFVFTAHYDHLGNLGRDLWFPGANDNASGTAAIITLARHYAKTKPEYDMYFIAFSGEDANLRGSNFFVEHPIFPLEQVKYLFNLDMIGDNNPVQYCEVSKEGEAGFEKMVGINAENGFFKSLHKGDLAANSDHYPFAMKGVPCILFENENGDAFKNYHTPQDNWENAIFDTYEPLFKLIVGFVAESVE